jgi:hypothetical protein
MDLGEVVIEAIYLLRSDFLHDFKESFMCISGIFSESY